MDNAHIVPPVTGVNPTDATATLQVPRSEAVLIARSWLETPYHLGGHIKGAGCDCATLLAEYAIEAGISLLCSEDLGLYSHDWFHNTSEERYKFGMLRHARKVIEGVCRGATAGGAAWMPRSFPRLPRSPLFNHGGIVTEWPRMIHAVDPRVTESDATRHYMTSFTEMCIFDPWDKPC